MNSHRRVSLHGVPAALGPDGGLCLLRGGSGIAPFRGFWQARLSAGELSGGANYLYLGVQSREKICFEDERELVNAALIKVHVAFSRDSGVLPTTPA